MPSPYRPAELAADRAIHLIGTVGGAVSAAALVALAACAADRATFVAVVVYACGLILMLGCSAGYNLSVEPRRREVLRRLDHAAIFVVIAGTYTPLATRLPGIDAAWLTAAVWIAALAGIAVKLLCARRLQLLSTVAYLALGWSAALIAPQLLASIDRPAALLIMAGGVLYSVGAGIHLWHGLPFHNAIWHGLVLLAAVCHYAAIVQGVVLAG
jgi:hemolysin III